MTDKGAIDTNTTISRTIEGDQNAIKNTRVYGTFNRRFDFPRTYLRQSNFIRDNRRTSHWVHDA
jgi:hypothetical protein